MAPEHGDLGAGPGVPQARRLVTEAVTTRAPSGLKAAATGWAAVMAAKWPTAGGARV